MEHKPKVINDRPSLEVDEARPFRCFYSQFKGTVHTRHYGGVFLLTPQPEKHPLFDFNLTIVSP